MEPIRTNCDLYLAIHRFPERFVGNERSLEDYLLGVLRLAEPYKDRESLTLAEFVELIENAFTQPCQTFDDVWRKQYDSLPDEDETYAGWRARVIKQLSLIHI